MLYLGKEPYVSEIGPTPIVSGNMTLALDHDLEYFVYYNNGSADITVTLP